MYRRVENKVTHGNYCDGATLYMFLWYDMETPEHLVAPPWPSDPDAV